jgi:hypothetical protein
MGYNGKTRGRKKMKKWMIVVVVALSCLPFLYAAGPISGNAPAWAGDIPLFTKIAMQDLLATGIRDNMVTGADAQESAPEMRQTLTILPGYQLELYREFSYPEGRGVQTNLVRYDYAIEWNDLHARSFVLTESGVSGKAAFRFSIVPVDKNSGYYSSSCFDSAMKELVVKFGRYTVLE